MTHQQEATAPQPPTREQIAEAVEAAFSSVNTVRYHESQGSVPTTMTAIVEVASRYERAVKDAVLALFPQSTPSAEPVSIADMAPGTTFTGFVRKRVNLTRVRGGVAYDGLVWPPDFVDPYTIGHVTPPPATPNN